MPEGATVPLDEVVRHLNALRSWAREQNAGNAFAEQVAQWCSQRLADLLRIFGARTDAGTREHRYYIDSLERMAKKQEAEHGR